MSTAVRIDFQPRPHQQRFLSYLLSHQRGGRAAWCVHRRGGKDLTAAHGTCAAMHQRIGGYWHVFPMYAQARKAIWEGFRSDGKRIIDNVFPREIVKRRNEQEMSIETHNGSIWRLIGSDRIDSVVGSGPVGVVFSEFALCKPNSWEFVRPMLRESEGWAAFISTPRGRNHFKTIFDIAGREPGWWRELQTIHDTKTLPANTVEDEIRQGMPEALARQEYLCDWEAALVGSVWGDLVEAIEKAGQVQAFDHARDAVFTAWDLGLSDATAIWFWRVADDGSGIDVLDYYESHGKPLSHYFDVLEQRGYSYRRHWLPHDARAKTLASGVSILDQCVNHFGSSAVAIGPQLSKLDGIQAARWLLQQQGLRFHSRCAEGINVLRQYHYKYDEGRKTFSAEPEHDWSSHGADGWRYLACVAKVTKQLVEKRPEPPRSRIRAVHEFNLDELWETAPRRVSGGRI